MTHIESSDGAAVLVRAAFAAAPACDADLLITITPGVAWQQASSGNRPASSGFSDTTLRRFP